MDMKEALINALRQKASPNSTISQAGNMADYQRHVIESQQNGQQPMTFQQFQQQAQQGVQK